MQPLLRVGCIFMFVFSSIACDIHDAMKKTKHTKQNLAAQMLFPFEEAHAEAVLQMSAALAEFDAANEVFTEAMRVRDKALIACAAAVHTNLAARAALDAARKSV